MKIEHDNTRVDEKEIHKLWDEVSLILLEKYNIGTLADMTGPTGINIVNGKKTVFAAEIIQIVDSDPKVIAGIISSKVSSDGKKVGYVAPYVWHSNLAMEPGTFTRLKNDYLRIGIVYV